MARTGREGNGRAMELVIRTGSPVGRPLSADKLERFADASRALKRFRKKTNMYDDELPRGFQDADLEMAQLTAAANRESRLRKRGICTHSWYKAPAGQPAVCNHCNKEFPTEAALLAERSEVLA
jgi:hypothetical protein